MKKQINKVAKFHEVFKIGNEESPIAKVPEQVYELRHRLMEEENNEYLQACKDGDLTEIADALGDMMYILSGTILKHGLQDHIEFIFNEIQRSNMSKLKPDGTPLLREDGKILKAENYFKPNIQKILNRPFTLKVLPFNAANKEQMEQAFAIRNTVFVVEQNVDAREEYDEFEDSSQHYLAYADSKPVATARWRRTEKGIKLERFAVLEEYRKHGVGQDILQAVLDDVEVLNEKVYLHAQEQVVNFYYKAGFRTKGERFMEANIGHYLMEWELR